MRGARVRFIALTSVLLVAAGAVIIAQAVAAGGASLGLLVGALFVAAGLMRLHLLRR